MPTPQDLQRLRALLAQLMAIGNVQRGELIRAEDWNSLVTAVTDVAQAVLSVEATPTVPPHEHLDQVGSAWLSQQLRDLVERGPLADPATQTRLLDLDQRLKRLTDRLDEMRGRVDEFRGRMTDVVTAPSRMLSIRVPICSTCASRWDRCSAISAASWKRPRR